MTGLRRTASALLVLPLAGFGLVVGLGGPAHAAGVTRYASPTGTAAQDCLTPAAACNIEKAVNNAGDNDEIVLAPGTYTTATTLQSAHIHLSLHGTPGQPRPVIETSAANGLLLNGFGPQVSDLVIDHSGSGSALFVFASALLVQRVQVRSSGAEACFVGTNGVFRDSVCVDTASGGTAMRDNFTGGPGTLEARNLTLVATGPISTGLKVGAGSSTSATFHGRNVLVSGTSADISSTTSGSGASSTVTMESSNYDTLAPLNPGATATPPGSGGNQTAVPVFTDTTSYHQAASSPTVDHGTVDADLGTADLDGDARVVHGAPDIGADEYVDRVAPDTALDKTPKRRTFSHRAKFTFHATEAGATFTCRLDKKPAVPCTSGFKKKVKKTGKHTFSVTATDGYGNADPTPATYTWKVKKR